MSLPLLVPALQSAFAAIGSIGPMLQAGLAAGTTALGFVADSQAAKAQTAANVAANDSARVQAISDYDQMTLRANQEKAAGQQKISEAALNRKKAVARAEASASEGNVGGLSVTALLTDIYGQEARIRDGVNQNLEATGQQIAVEKTAIARNLKNTVQTRPPVQKPSLIGSVIEGGLGIANAYKDDLRTTARLTAKKGSTSNYSG